MTSIKLYFIAVFLLIITCLFNVNGQTVSRPGPALVVNGTPIENGVKTVGAKTYVDLDAITNALNLSVKKSSSVIAIQSGCGNSASTGGTTSIAGNLSYYFNRNYGNKPDVGSKVYLLEASSEPLFTETESVFFVNEEMIVAKTKEDMKKYRVLHSTAADGNGRFEFKGIAPKKYLLVAVSSHANGKTQSEILGKKLTKVIELKLGQAIDVSHDFGTTFY